jgi:tRNA threonylcarbamoyladenosine biosynthesis protein TsaE
VTSSTYSSEETEELGARVAERLEPGDVVLVSGDLGAGKTTLIRGACRALGVTEPVTSPTFTIGQRYAGRVPVSHLDLYRLADLGAEDPALLADYVEPSAIAFVEWPEIGGAEPSLQPTGKTLTIEIRHAGGDARDVVVRDAS